MIVLLAALGGLGWWLAKRPSGGQSGMFPPGGPGAFTVTVGHATVQPADLPVTLDALGTVTPLVTVTLTPQVGGVLTEVLFQEGQDVKKGQLLARIDPRAYEQALMQAQGTRARDEAQLDAARVTLARYRTLLGQDSIARQEVDTQAALVKQLEAAVLGDKAAEAAARLNLEHTRLVSPVTGRIGLRTVDPGNMVTANSSTGIATITQMNPIDVEFSVPQDRVPDIQGQVQAQAALKVDAMDRTRTQVLDSGRFLTLNNVIDTTTGTVKAKARFGNDKGSLFPNQFVNVRLTLRTDRALVVPVTAVRTGPQGPFVYVIGEDSRVAMRPVKRGESTVQVVAITEGLKEGERVVTEGGDRLSDGSLVQLQGAAPPAPRANRPRGQGERRGPPGEGGQRGPRQGGGGRP
ncbi:efflux RND transporter periplasmic adaptor subunit [Xenophilus arseniciresistens]|uniref:Efflux RND transporter periplasmic adaptor subunit n=1 Tax=Xenophilus arseniciresistens TaxID=1283306 RepID=A0AAE3N5N6_9BURK|nr:efflux RND transporter periplasmic adaptor subunit [Xenophilus arseniciresistens]MDA7414836.1 efflux RND transporter periplasmic adaptor subunit [Xenophilus arseniciresistens]